MIALKLSLLLSPFPLAAFLLLPGDQKPIMGGESAEDRACAATGARIGHETVRVAWTRIGVVHRDVDVFYCVLRGDADAPLDFTRDAERVRFSLVGRGRSAKIESVAFTVSTSAGHTLTLGPSTVRIAPRSHRSCSVDLCSAFIEPGERVVAVDVLTK